MSRLLARLDWFLIGMMIAVFLAWLIPGPGSEGGSMHPELVTKIGIALIFFLHGLTLSFKAMKDGAMQWKSHIAVQATTFVLFPLLGLAFYKCTDGIVDPNLQLGFFYLCALPSTVSSSVAMTAAAKGNVPVAVFNATLSSLIGIAITPFWVSFILHQDAQTGALGDTILDLCKWLLLPLIVGQVLGPWFGDYARRHKKYVSKVDRLTILLLVYTSFCDSFAQHIWSGHATQGMVATIIATAVLFFVVLGALWFACSRFGLAPELREAIVFCGTKKSLATGVPMARLIFAGNPGLSIILLPIMLYHPLQLFVCGPLASHWAKQKEIAR